MRVSGGNRLKRKYGSKHTYHKLATTPDSCTGQIIVDLITDVDFKREPSCDVLIPCRVLVAVSAFTRRKYRRGLGPLCAFLLRYVTEETAFWILCGLLTQRFPREYFNFVERGQQDGLISRCWSYLRASSDGTCYDEDEARSQRWMKVSGGRRLQRKYGSKHAYNVWAETPCSCSTAQIIMDLIMDVDFKVEPSRDVMIPCRVLVAVSAFTRRKYTRGLGPICAFLLRHVTEEDAFWILSGLLTQRLPRAFSDFVEHGAEGLIARCWSILRASDDGTSDTPGKRCIKVNRLLKRKTITTVQQAGDRSTLFRTMLLRHWLLLMCFEWVRGEFFVS